jgi:hypothetical protein
VNVVWDSYYNRMYDVVDEIMSYQPATVAGLTVLMRAVMLHDNELWTSGEDECEHPLMQKFV